MNHTELQQRVAKLTSEQRAHLRGMIDSVRRSTGPAPILPRPKTTVPVPLSPAQRRLWFVSSADPLNTAYNLASAFRMRGDLDLAALRLAANALEQRHEMLRTTFVQDEQGRPAQVVHAPCGAPFHVRDLKSEGAGSRTEEMQRVILEEANIPFDLHTGPVWRISVLLANSSDAVLVINVHHIAFDGWSLGVMVRELFEYYVAAKRGRIQIKALPVQYADYSLWNNERIERQLRAPQEEFWKNYLADVPPLLDLPRDRPRTAQAGRRGAVEQVVIGRALFNALRDLGQREGATPFNVFMTLFATLLYRYSNQTDFVLGTPVSGRELESTHPLIGVFANTLPVRVTLDPHGSFRTNMRRLRASALDAFANGDLSFDSIVEAVRPERVEGCNPVFQSMFAYQNKVDPVDADGLYVIYEIFDPGTTKFDLSLDIFEGPEGPTCLFEYDVSLYCAQRIQRMARHFTALAQQVLESQDTPIARLEYLNPAERALALASLHAPKELPFMGSVVDVFVQHAIERPHAIAVVDGERRITYAQLDHRSSEIAAGLVNRGIKRGDLIGLCMARGSVLIESILGVLKSGAAFVALDPEHPIERRVFVCKDANVALVLAEAIGSEMSELPVPVCDLHALLVNMRPDIQGGQAGTAQHDDIAYVIYTSGTTGQPKGACISHRNWLSALHGWITAYELGSKVQRHFQMASFPFDVFCGDFIRALGSGGSLVICPKTMFGDAPALFDFMQREQIDCVEFVPAVFRSLAAYLNDSGARLSFLKVLIVASDTWYRSEYAAFKQLAGAQTRLINSYGTAETTIDSTWYELTESTASGEDLKDTAATGLVPIGRPFSNVEIYVLDDRQQLLPPGIPGEIYIAGWGVAGGYLNRPELTAQKFIPHPFDAGAPTLMYRTGDIGQLRADGQYELLGRRDHQVKIRGQRVELAEIETALLRHPSVHECVVILCGDDASGKRLVAYVVPAGSNGGIDAAELRAHLQRWVPVYMIPSAVVELAALPLSPNGKVDHRALPKPTAGNDDSSTAFAAPRTLTEELLSGIWCGVLGVPRAGIHESFFALGGHSLLAFQLVAQIKKLFSVELQVQTLFANSTIAQLAALIAERQGKAQDYSETINAVPVITPDVKNRYQPFPLTPIQQAYWLGRSDVFEFGNVTAHSYDEFETPLLDVERFERAWNKVIARHDMLRAVVLPDGTQVILPQVPEYRVKVADLRTAHPDEIQASFETIRAELSHQILDVQTWPPFEVRVSQLPENKSRVHFSTDAITFDVRSFLIVLGDLVTYYTDDSAVLKPLSLSFRDYVLAEQEMHKSARYRRALDYWRKRVPDLPLAPQLPAQKSPAQIQRPKFTRLHNTLDTQRWARLKQRATREGLTPTGILLAAYAEVLTKHSRAPRFSLNLTFLNRHPVHPDVNDIVGEFTSLTLLAVDNSQPGKFVERARKIQEDLWRDLEHNDIGGVQVIREIARHSGDPTRAKMPVVFTSALVMSIPTRDEKFPVTPVHRDGITQTSQVWLDCGVWEEAGVLMCNWDVVKEVYPEGFIEPMFDRFWALVNCLADDDRAWQQTIPGYCETIPARTPVPLAVAEHAPQATLVSLFTRQLATNGARYAIQAPGKSITYTQLAQYAAGVKRRVNGRVAHGELIAVAMHKGWEQVAAALGIMAAGAAYLPIDPDLPSARIRQLLDQSGTRHVITQPWLAERFAEYDNVDTHCVDERCVNDIEVLLDGKAPTPDDLAYVIFTSGSTGTPKGVMIDHRGAVNTILDVNERFAIGEDDSVLCVSAFNFDLSVYDIFGLLAAGGCSVFPEYERRLDPTHWFEQIQMHRVTVWNTVPALMGLLADYVKTQGRELTGLRHVLLSGDWIPVQLPERIRAIAKQASITSLGGATEASIWSIWYSIKAVDVEWQSIPYGCAMKNQGMYVLDHQLESCPTWVTGEIYIGGVGLSLGYWGDREKTDHAFIVHPRTGARLYRTGDLGRWLSDGNIEFIGRSDFQVKIQGHRIELGEIETVLSKHPLVGAAVVNVMGELRGQKRLIAYVVPQDGKPVELEEIRAYLRERLPDYMVPRQFMAIEQLPLSANGKVNRSALPVPAEHTASTQHRYIAPQTGLEQQLASIWREVLAVERIGTHDNFFEIGGDSMLAIQMISNVRMQLHKEITLRDVFSRPCLADMAKDLQLMRGGTQRDEI